MRMYDPECSCEDIEEQIDNINSVIDDLESAKRTLKKIDDRFFEEDIDDLDKNIEYFKNELTELEDDLEIKREEENSIYKQEMFEMNYEFERSRL